MKKPTFIENLKKEDKELFNGIVRLDKDYILLNENEQCSHVLFLLRGEIEVYKISENGKIFQLYTIKEGESCVLNLSCVLSDNTYLAYAKAITDIECVLIPSSIFLRMFEEVESLRKYVFNLISTRLIQITAKVEGIVLESLETRLQNWLLNQKSEIIYVTHDEIANQLGSAREVISRQLKKWENEKRVVLYRGKIRLVNL
ncbi:MAG: Crp/Fnr family transcriptional regulator [Ignavibacteria bacterium]|nr:Crp/Fnr family transcriptional regulator [Ignavibacteria bacterium]